jgi:acyl carrier protein
MDTQVLDRVREIAADVLQLDRGALNAESSPQSVESWDSVQHLNLVLALEEQFGMQFEPDEMDGMKSIGAIAEMLSAKGASA